MPRWHPLPLARGCPEGVQVGSGVSEVQAAFVTGLATPRFDHGQPAFAANHKSCDDLCHI